MNSDSESNSESNSCDSDSSNDYEEVYIRFDSKTHFQGID